MVVRTDHSPLRQLPIQNSVNTRICKWLATMQEYNLDIRHIPGKVNPVDHLSHRSLDQGTRHKNVVRDEMINLFKMRGFLKMLRMHRFNTLFQILCLRINFFQSHIQDQAQDQFSPVFKISPRRRQCMTSIY